MRPTRLHLAALGDSAWAPVDYAQAGFGIGLFAIPSEDATLTYTVQHSPDDPSQYRMVTYARAATVMTVTDFGPDGTGHGVSTGDNVLLANSSGFDNMTVGYDIQSTPTNSTYTLTVANSGPTAGTAQVSTLRVFPHPYIAAQTARMDGNYGYNVRAVRLKVTAYTAGMMDLIILQGTNV